MEATLDEIEAISNRDGEMTGVPTGFADLDELTNGLHGGQMVIIAARPAVGKSTLALDLCRAASHPPQPDLGHLQPGDDAQRDHHAAAVAPRRRSRSTTCATAT